MKEPTNMRSYYEATADKVPQFDALQGSYDADVCIIGGGITGISAAWHLAKSGKKVILLEANRLSWAASGRNAGFMIPSMDHSPEDMEARVGKSIAREFWALSEHTVEYMKSIITENNIECHLKDGILFTAKTAQQGKAISEGAKRWQDQYELDYMEIIDGGELAQQLGTDIYNCGVLYRSTPTLHPLIYTLGIARLAVSEGVKVFENTRALGYEDKGKRVVIRTDSGGEVNAGKLLLATNAYLGKLEPKLAGRFLPTYSAMAATEVLTPEQLNRVMNLDCGVLEVGLGRFYRLTHDKRLTIGGGNIFTNRNCDKSKIIHKKMLEDIFPQLKDVNLEYSWGGWLGFTSAGDAPDIGRLSANVHYAQAIPVTWATIHGQLLADELEGGSRSYQLLADMDIRGLPFGNLIRRPYQVLNEIIGSAKAMIHST
jgi:gamma-glutamylputrescine oxidase